MRVIFAIIALLVDGCRSGAPRTASAISSATAKVVNNPHTLILPDFIYPPNMTNFTWSLQSSTDLRTWTTLVSGMSGAPSGYLTLTNNGSCCFFRMKGIAR